MKSEKKTHFWLYLNVTITLCLSDKLEQGLLNETKTWFS